MMNQVFINGQLYTIYEMFPRIEDIKQEMNDLKEKKDLKERKERKDHFKQMARFNYRKK